MLRRHSLFPPTPFLFLLSLQQPPPITHNSCQCPLEEKWCVSNKTDLFLLLFHLLLYLLSSINQLTPPHTAPPQFSPPCTWSMYHITFRQAAREQWWWQISCLPGAHMWKPRVAFSTSPDRYAVAAVAHQSADSLTHVHTDRQTWLGHLDRVTRWRWQT